MENFTEILRGIKEQETDCKLCVGMVPIFLVAILISFLMGQLTNVFKESFLLLDLIHLHVDKFLLLVAVGFLVFLAAIYFNLYLFKIILQRKREREMLALEIFKHITSEAKLTSAQSSSDDS